MTESRDDLQLTLDELRRGTREKIERLPGDPLPDETRASVIGGLQGGGMGAVAGFCFGFWLLATNEAFDPDTSAPIDPAFYALLSMIGMTLAGGFFGANIGAFARHRSVVKTWKASLLMLGIAAGGVGSVIATLATMCGLLILADKSSGGQWLLDSPVRLDVPVYAGLLVGTLASSAIVFKKPSLAIRTGAVFTIVIFWGGLAAALYSGQYLLVATGLCFPLALSGALWIWGHWSRRVGERAC